MLGRGLGDLISAKGLTLWYSVYTISPLCMDPFPSKPVRNISSILCENREGGWGPRERGGTRGLRENRARKEGSLIEQVRDEELGEEGRTGEGLGNRRGRRELWANG